MKDGHLPQSPRAWHGHRGRWMLLRPFLIEIGLGLNWGVAAYEEDLGCQCSQGQY